jgi:hypothetical protein
MLAGLLLRPPVHWPIDQTPCAFGRPAPGSNPGGPWPVLRGGACIWGMKRSNASTPRKVTSESERSGGGRSCRDSDEKTVPPPDKALPIAWRTVIFIDLPTVTRSPLEILIHSVGGRALKLLLVEIDEVTPLRLVVV